MLERLARARAETDRIFALLRPEALYDRPIAERHRIIFYIGHLEAFDWNLLRPRLLHKPTFDPALDQLFAFGIDPVDGGLPSDLPGDWPTLDVVRGYAARIRTAIDDALADFDPGSDDAILLHTAIEHRLMHAETLAYMLHQMPFSQKLALEQPSVAHLARPEFALLDIPEGDVTLGQSHSPAAFGWDNEYGEHRVHVPAFAIDRHKITNGQYLEFVDAGGYYERTFWDDADWEWRTTEHITQPVFWNSIGGRWHWAGMFADIPLPLDWPVYVSHAEAVAYARWAGRALPTEAEWQRAVYCTPTGEEHSYPWGETPPDARHGYFDFERWDPSAVNAFPAARSAFGAEGALANGWEWTATPFAPFAGFEAREFYPGYSANFFDGKHYVMKGGSTRTDASMLRRSFRNWFQPRYQYAYAGFRCVSR